MDHDKALSSHTCITAIPFSDASLWYLQRSFSVLKTVIVFPKFSIVFAVQCTCYVYSFHVKDFFPPIASATFILLNEMTLTFLLVIYSSHISDG